MTENDYHTLVAEAAAEAYELTLDKRFKELITEAEKRIAATPLLKPLVFACSAPGYLAIGPADQPRIVRQPDEVAGVEIGHQILFYGETVGSVLDAFKLMPECERQPVNALRNALKRGAAWLRSEGRCEDLAALLEPPNLRISSSGRIVVRSGRRPPIIFSLPSA